MNRRQFVGTLIGLAGVVVLPKLPPEKTVVMPRTWSKTTTIHIPETQEYIMALAQRMREVRDREIAKVLNNAWRK